MKKLTSRRNVIDNYCHMRHQKIAVSDSEIFICEEFRKILKVKTGDRVRWSVEVVRKRGKEA